MMSRKKDFSSVENNYALRGLDLIKQNLQLCFIWPLKNRIVNLVGQGVFLLNTAIFLILLVIIQLYTNETFYYIWLKTLIELNYN